MVYRQIIGPKRGEILMPVSYRRSGLMIKWSLLDLKCYESSTLLQWTHKRSDFKTGIFHWRTRSSLRCL